MFLKACLLFWASWNRQKWRETLNTAPVVQVTDFFSKGIVVVTSVLFLFGCHGDRWWVVCLFFVSWQVFGISGSLVEDPEKNTCCDRYTVSHSLLCCPQIPSLSPSLFSTICLSLSLSLALLPSLRQAIAAAAAAGGARRRWRLRGQLRGWTNHPSTGQTPLVLCVSGMLCTVFPIHLFIVFDIVTAATISTLTAAFFFFL